MNIADTFISRLNLQSYILGSAGKVHKQLLRIAIVCRKQETATLSEDSLT